MKLAKLLEGKLIAEGIREQIKKHIAALGFKPLLASILCSDNVATQTYSKSQKKIAEDLGIDYELHKLDADIKESDLIDFINKLNVDKKVNGIIIQLPLPKQIDYRKISQYILPVKDVEGISPINMGKIVFGTSTLPSANARMIPCTAASVMELIKACGIDLYGKEVLIVGHSEIVGKPLALLLLDKFATVTIAHIGTSKAGKLEEHVKKADVLVVAVGIPGLIKGDWIKQDAVVIDVGINRVNEKLVGDVEFDVAQKHASFITPVPGGVGPLTVTMLMRNLVEATKQQL